MDTCLDLNERNLPARALFFTFSQINDQKYLVKLSILIKFLHSSWISLMKLGKDLFINIFYVLDGTVHFFVFYFIKISKFALPGVMLMYERTSKDRKKERKKEKGEKSAEEIYRFTTTAFILGSFIYRKLDL